MRHWRIASAAVLATLAVLAVASCNHNDSTGPGDSANLAGTYSLVSLTFAGLPTLEPPAATGSFTLTDSTYTVSVSINVPGQEQQINDTGTYTVSGSNWTQTSSTQNVQSVGTYALSGGTLTVDVTTAGQQVTTIWLKQ